MPGRSARPDHVTIGKVVGPHGILGGLKINPSTDFIERFQPGQRVFIDGTPVTIKRLTAHKTQLRIETVEITDRNRAEELKWAQVTVPASELPELEEDEFYTADLIGLQVVDPSGRALGTVDSILPSPTHDILVIGEAMVPVVREFIKEINLDRKVVVIEPIPGMFD
jgi:16S rRNA processing protein RimM